MPAAPGRARVPGQERVPGLVSHGVRGVIQLRPVPSSLLQELVLDAVRDGVLTNTGEDAHRAMAAHEEALT